MTLSELFRESVRILDGSCESPSLDARLIISHTLELSDSQYILHPDLEIPQDKAETALEHIRQRKEGKPVAYITGHRAFYRSDFLTEDGILIPQPDTETLVESALEQILKAPGKRIRILDMCSGTGCVGISIARELMDRNIAFSLYLSDVNPKCTALTARNADLILGEDNADVHIILSDLFENIDEKDFDILVSNPPYIRSDVARALPREVTAQGMLALDGGEDGLDLVRRILRQCGPHMRKGSAVLMEIGYDQGRITEELFKASGLENTQVIRDLAGNDRVVKGIV